MTFISSKASSLFENINSNYIKPVKSKIKSIYLRYGLPIVYGTTGALLAIGASYYSNTDPSSPSVLATSLTISLAGGYFFQSQMSNHTEAIEARRTALKKVEKEINSVAPKKAPLIAAFLCESDHNGAFDPTNYLISALSPLKRRSRLFLSLVTGPHEIEEQMELLAAKSPIHHLILGGHGNPKSILFRKDTLLDSNLGYLSQENLDVALFRYLKPKGKIFLISCSTGEPEGIAQKISEATQRVVCAPYKTTSAASLRFYMNSKKQPQMLCLENYGAFAQIHYIRGRFSLPMLSKKELLSIKQSAQGDRLLLTFVALEYFLQKQTTKAMRCLKEARQSPLPQNGADEIIKEIENRYFKTLS